MSRARVLDGKGRLISTSARVCFHSYGVAPSSLTTPVLLDQAQKFLQSLTFFGFRQTLDPSNRL